MKNNNKKTGHISNEGEKFSYRAFGESIFDEKLMKEVKISCCKKKMNYYEGDILI